LKARQPVKVENRAPGPGAYTSKDSPAKTIAPSYRFGSSAQREKLASPVAPGPGAYHIPSEVANLAGYTGARSKEFGYI
jgi:hypothetical protein